MSDLWSILQNLHTEIDLWVYLETVEVLMANQNIVEEEEENERKAEPADTDGARKTKISIKQYGK